MHSIYSDHDTYLHMNSHGYLGMVRHPMYGRLNHRAKTAVRANNKRIHLALSSRAPKPATPPSLGFLRPHLYLLRHPIQLSPILRMNLLYMHILHPLLLLPPLLLKRLHNPLGPHHIPDLLHHSLLTPHPRLQSPQVRIDYIVPQKIRLDPLRPPDFLQPLPLGFGSQDHFLAVQDGGFVGGEGTVFLLGGDGGAEGGGVDAFLGGVEEGALVAVVDYHVGEGEDCYDAGDHCRERRERVSRWINFFFRKGSLPFGGWGLGRGWRG